MIVIPNEIQTVIPNEVRNLHLKVQIPRYARDDKRRSFGMTA